jgi:hypothetical protein
LHLLAIAQAAEVSLAIEDFEIIRRRVPVLCGLKPSGRHVTIELHQTRGAPQVMKMLLESDLLHGVALRGTGHTLAELLAEVPAEPRAHQGVIHPWSNPDDPEGHLAIRKGNPAEDADRQLLQLEVCAAELAERRCNCIDHSWCSILERPWPNTVSQSPQPAVAHHGMSFKAQAWRCVEPDL